MRTFVAFLMMGASVSAAEPTLEQTRRARAALALAFAPPTYAEQRAKALKENRPLVVFVGQPRKLMADCVCHTCDTFADIAVGVVVGLPEGDQLRRIDLPGRPDEAEIREAIARAAPERTTRGR